MPGTVTGSTVQWFAGGRIYYSWATSAHEVHGLILNKYLSLGSVNSFVGYPLSDEVAVTGGRASQFQGANIYYSGATGAHEVHGAILSTYLRLGGTGSRLGLPTSDEHRVTGGRRSNFSTAPSPGTQPPARSSSPTPDRRSPPSRRPFTSANRADRPLHRQRRPRTTGAEGRRVRC